MINSKRISPRVFFAAILTFVVLGCATLSNPLPLSKSVEPFSQTSGTLSHQETQTADAATKIIGTQSTPPSTWKTTNGVYAGINQIRTLLYTSKGSLWAGGPNSLIYWNLQNNQSTVFVFDKQNHM